MDELIDNIKVQFLEGFNKDKILAIEKGKRPLPKTYLNYIKRHLKKIENGVSYLVKKSSLDKFGRDILGMPDNTQFVMTKTEMDTLLKKANGNLHIIETELGIPSGLWANDDLIRIDVKLPGNTRIPDGNEMGANDLWLPDGKLPNGYLEAVIDNVKIGNYTETKINLN